MNKNGNEEEFCIELPGRGYIGWMGTFQENNPDGLRTLEDAVKSLDAAIRKYVGMGIPEIAKELRIVKRTITWSVGDWEPIDG